MDGGAPAQGNEPERAVDRTARAVIGAAIEVHRTFGPGFLESVYEQALCLELTHWGVPFVAQHRFSLSYRGQAVGEGRVDLLVDQALILELKTVEALNNLHQAQLLSYLKALQCPLGLLINFNVPVLKDGIKRIAL
jgi:GxxExxY protein